MRNLLLPDKLEEVLLARWASFIDVKRLMAYVMTCVRDAHLPHVVEDDVPTKGTQITISRFEWNQAGFLVWADFSIPTGENQMAVGTTELVLSPDGSVSHRNTIGNQFVQKKAAS